MKWLIRGLGLEILFGLSMYGVAFAQEKGFMEKYFPIAELFDNPVFFWCVMGSAVAFVAFALIYLQYSKYLEKKAEEWGSKKKPEELVELIASPVPQEARKAFVYLRNNAEPKFTKLVMKTIEEQRKQGSIRQELLFLLEDWQSTEAIPMLETIAKGKSKMAEQARMTLQHLEVEVD